MPETVAKDTAKGTSGWTTETLFVYFKDAMNAAEAKNQQQFHDAQRAVQAALDAAQKAVDKAENALVGWKESQNEWRSTIADIISSSSGKGAGLTAMWGYVLAAIMLMIAIAGLYFKSK